MTSDPVISAVKEIPSDEQTMCPGCEKPILPGDELTYVGWEVYHRQCYLDSLPCEHTMMMESSYAADEETDEEVLRIDIPCPHCKQDVSYFFQGILSGDRSIIVIATCRKCHKSIKVEFYTPA